MLRNILTTSILTYFKNTIQCNRQIYTLPLETNFIPPKSYMLNIMEDKFQFLGLIKNLPHYINSKNEVYCNFDNNIAFEHVADWIEHDKMLWTDNPIIYKLHIHQGIKFFYDVDFLDAYSYCYNKNIVIPIGMWNKKKQKFY